MKQRKGDWCVLKDGALYCKRCAGTLDCNKRLPMPVDAFCEMMEGFVKIHKHCPPFSATHEFAEDNNSRKS